MITRNKILFFTCIMFAVLAIVPQTIADVREEQTVAEKLIDAAGPEDTAFDAEGRIYISTADGIIRLQPDGSKQEVFAKTPTHPLGLHFDANGNLIVCDGELYSVAPDGTVTMLTNKVDDSSIILANGLDIAADGTIYFADSCFHFTRDEVGKEFENPGPHGRLLAYEPATGVTRLVLGDLWFANGVAVSPDQSFVLVAEALGNRVMRYWLTGDKRGQSEVFIEKVMGVDNLDVNSRGMFWIPSSAEGIMLEVDKDGNIIRKLNILHPSGEPYLSLAGAREHEGKLYLNSYDYVALESVKSSSLEKLATGFIFTEGPVWNTAEGCLFFSDIPADKMMAYTKDKDIKIFRDPSGKSNALTLDKQGRLITCEHANRRVSRTEKDGTVITIADRYEGKHLNSPNDIVVKSDGSIYFTDPPFGLTAEYGILGQQELTFQGVYRLSPDGKKLTLLVDDFDRPNGIAFSPDESLLYINDTNRWHVRVFEVEPDGTISNGRVFAELHGPEPGHLDGMKVDSEGNVYVTGPGGIWIFDSSGNKLGRIDVPEIVGNIAWGDEDWKALYITASSSLYRIRLGVKGIQVP